MSDEITESVERAEAAHRVMEAFGKRGQDYLIDGSTIRVTVRVANLDETRKADIEAAFRAAKIQANLVPWNGVRGALTDA